MCGIFWLIGRVREATQEPMGIVVFLLPEKVQVCSSIIIVTCNQRDENIPGIETVEDTIKFVN
jgi:hypothetical protein